MVERAALLDSDDNPLLRLRSRRTIRDTAGDAFVCAGPWAALAVIDWLLARPAIGGANPAATMTFFAWQPELVAYFSYGCGSLYAQTIHRRHVRIQERIPAEELALLRISPADYIEAILAFPLCVLLVCVLFGLANFYVLSGAVGAAAPVPVFRRYDEFRTGAALLRVAMLVFPLLIATLIALRACLYVSDPRASKRCVVLDWAFPWGAMFLGSGIGVHFLHAQNAFLAKSGFLVFLGFFSVATSLMLYPWLAFLRHREGMFREDSATEFAPRFWFGLWRVPGRVRPAANAGGGAGGGGGGVNTTTTPATGRVRPLHRAARRRGLQRPPSSGGGSGH